MTHHSSISHFGGHHSHHTFHHQPSHHGHHAHHHHHGHHNHHHHQNQPTTVLPYPIVLPQWQPPSTPITVIKKPYKPAKYCNRCKGGDQTAVCTCRPQRRWRRFLCGM
ncbi:uncharacterized protein BDZ99DRAFT_45879 [Mytilinidion resinicola]|uniref:Uncharacterized protein n=1 Tax=Mytilinidion resinicola TaxID=574789 RepID=A0A6A6YKR6_9PEZI|nr:uncharacterized protein BDZ99DRAFT_45879 [Mytilinidion resinicola]KAF2809128.1 hypothetical protein BDZ99DRAFT_45879 [Mytilinidion resinicola]